MYKTMEEIADRIKVLSGQDDLDEDELKELETLNAQASKMRAREEAKKNLLAADEQAKADAEAETNRKIEEAVKKERERHEAENRRLPFGEPPYQAQFSHTWKYDSLDATELSLLIEMERCFKMNVSKEAIDSMMLRVAEMKDNNTEPSRKDVAYIKNAFKMATGINPDIKIVEDAIKAAKAATDPMYTGGSLIGADWVGTAYSTSIWAAIRANTMVASKVPSDIIPDGYSSKTWPLESTDMTWYKIAEATASDATLLVPAATVEASQMATASKNITVGKMGARGLYTGEMEEDSLIRFAPQLRGQLETSGTEIIEHLFIDGDVETSANKSINDVAGDPGTSAVYQIADGFRKLPLITNTANSRSASGGLVIEDYINTIKLMGTAGLAGADPSKVGFVVDGNVHYKNMELPEVKTRDVAGNAATVENGALKGAYGVQIIPSWQMHRTAADRKANTAGKVDTDTTSNNTTGSIVAVRWDQWKQAYKRRMTMETTRIANADSWEIVALARIGLAYRDSEASAITYNVGV